VSAPEPDHRKLMTAAIQRDGDAQRALFGGDAEAAREAFGQAAELYRRSWELAPPTSYGRLVGMLKSAVLAGGGEEQAAYALEQLRDERDPSPPAAYALALAALITGDDLGALHSSEAMRTGSEAFTRTAEAIAGLAARERERYVASVAAILHDFEQRSEHLTGVPIADTALVLERLADRRGLAAGLESPMLPAASAPG
jgi:hypothetical protein